MDRARWDQIIKAAYTDRELRLVLAGFLARNNVELRTRSVDEDGKRSYMVWLDRPHVAEVEREGSKHWVVKER